MPYVDRTDQRRADLAYYYRNRERILSLRKQRRRVANEIAARELNARMIEIENIDGSKRFALGIPQGEAGSYNTVKKNKLRRVDFTQGKGKFCVIEPCQFCGRFGLYMLYERKYFFGIHAQSRPTRAIDEHRRDALSPGIRGYLEWCCDDCGKHPVCVVAFCDLCGICGPPKKVYCRNDVHGWNRVDHKDYQTPSKETLCMKCWNKARAITTRYWQAEANRLQVNRILKEISNERRNRKNIDNGPASGLSGDDDGRREERRP